jgi:hypothetical protein
MAHAAEITMGTAERRERFVMATTRKPANTFRRPMLLNIDQLSSKYMGTAEDMVRWW